MFHIDKTLMNPNISVTIRFTPVLHNWLKTLCDREGVPFNQAVLQCCKHAMELDLTAESSEDERDNDMRRDTQERMRS